MRTRNFLVLLGVAAVAAPSLALSEDLIKQGAAAAGGAAGSVAGASVGGPVGGAVGGVVGGAIGKTTGKLVSAVIPGGDSKKKKRRKAEAEAEMRAAEKAQAQGVQPTPAAQPSNPPQFVEAPALSVEGIDAASEESVTDSLADGK